MWILKERQNKKYTKHTISWVLLSVTAKMRVKENAGVNLDWEPSSGLWSLASNLPPKGKLMVGQWKVPPRPLVTKKVAHVAGGQNQETIEIWRYSVKEVSHFVDSYHWLPAEALLKRIVRVTNLGAVSLVLNTAEWTSTFGWIQDPQLSMGQS